MAVMTDAAAEQPAPRSKRVRTPTILQLEAAECGAASLAMILAYYGRRVPLEELRKTCGVSRDGSKASNVLNAGRRYGLIGRGFKKEPQTLLELALPSIIFWNFNHFVVLEGLGPKGAWLNDPALGRRRVSHAEFEESFTGVVLAFEPGPNFTPGGRSRSLIAGLVDRLVGTQTALLFAAIASAGLIVPGLAGAAFTRVFVDFVAIQHLASWLLPLVVTMLGVAAVRAGLIFVQQRVLLRLRVFMALEGAARFMWHVLRLPVEYFSARYAVEIASRNALNERLALLLAGELAVTILNAMAIAVYALAMAQYDLVLTGVGVAFALINLVCLWVVSRNLVDISRRLEMDEGKVRSITVRGFSMLDTLKATGTESLLLARWGGYHAKVLNAEQEFGRIQVFLSALPFALTAASATTIITVGGLRVMDGAITIGMLLAFQALMIMFFQPVNQLVQFGAQLQEVSADVERLDDVLRNDVDSAFVPGSPATIVAPIRLDGALSVVGLRYGYGPLDPPLIDDFCLELPPGGRVALVGSSGSGKSTIGKLIAGLYRPWGGEIRLDDIPIDRLSRPTLRHSIGYVDQNAALFPGTVRDNITLWDPTLGDERVMASANDAVIHGEIAVRPLGYDHQVDEGGRNFSGGQRQRIILARALAREPSLVVLDEATSMLDAATEYRFMEQLRRRGCGCIVIAHRLSTIRDCDEIIVLDNGVVVERGRHDALMAVDGRYRMLVES